MDSENGGRVELTVTLTAFGFDPRQVTIDAIARPQSWRVTRALIAGGIALGVTPVVALIPPHFPWLIGALVTGGILARRRLTERFTLITMAGACPRCGESVSTEPGRLSGDRTVRCGACGQDSSLSVAGV
jgi:hypothetical protein